MQALEASPDGSVLASRGDDGALILGELQSGEYLRTLQRDCLGASQYGSLSDRFIALALSEDIHKLIRFSL